jgi:hypothetical protein
MANVPFSKRHGYTAAKEITIREDAPENLRYFVLDRAESAGVRPYTMRDIACSILRRRPDPSNWSEDPNVCDEAQHLVYSCDWYKFYDILERIDRFLRMIDEKKRGPIPTEGYPKHPDFEAAVNEFLIEEGIGWQLVNGEIIARGEEAFEAAVKTAQAKLEGAGRPTAAGRIHDALQALSRRPEPDSAGAISHAIAALECVAGDIAGNDKATFGDILRLHSELFPGGLKKGLEGIWGYSCNEGARHGREGKAPEREEAELIVGLAANVATYLSRKAR